MLVDRYEPKTNNFVKLVVGFHFHFNRFNGVEKIVDEKFDHTHPTIRTHFLKKSHFLASGRDPIAFFSKPPRAKIQPN